MKYVNQRFNILKTDQAVTNAWADVGSVFNVLNTAFIGVHIHYTPNSSVGLKFRLVAMTDLGSGADEYCLPIEAVSPSYVEIAPHLVKLPVSGETKIVKGFDLKAAISFLKLQVMADTVGATAAEFHKITILTAGHY